MSTKIEWTDETWNPISGCTKVSEGCDHCYIERTPPFRMEGRKFLPLVGPEVGKTTGVQLHPERLDRPLTWRKPRRVFVNSLSDLFHADVPDEYIARVFAVMALASQHTFQILTKRPGRMRSLLSSPGFRNLVEDAIRGRVAASAPARVWYDEWPLPNVWLGVSVENQKWADVRIPLLLNTPAAVRFLSCEPLLGEVYLTNDLLWALQPCPSGCGCTLPTHPDQHDCFCDGPCCMDPDWDRKPDIDWVIVGGESGPGARPMHPDWARSLRDQCTESGIPFHFKQWGEWAPVDQSPEDTVIPGRIRYHEWPVGPDSLRLGKHGAGRELDGRTWDEYPGSPT